MYAKLQAIGQVYDIDPEGAAITAVSRHCAISLDQISFNWLLFYSCDLLL
jgi:hypothetical protein